MIVYQLFNILDEKYVITLTTIQEIQDFIYNETKEKIAHSQISKRMKKQGTIYKYKIIKVSHKQ